MDKYTYNYSFEARLHQADEISKEAFNEARTLFEGYGVKLRASWKKIRVYKGRELYGFIVFRGKKLALCLNLNPKDLENTKYKGKDISDKRLYKETPFEFKITSARKVSYIEDLIDMMFASRFEYNEKKVYDDKFRYYNLDTMVEKGLVKKTLKKGQVLEDGETLEEVEYVPFKEETGHDVEEVAKVEVVDEPEKEFVQLKDKKIKVNQKFNRRSLAVINLVTLNNNFNDGDFIDLEVLKLKGLVDVHKAWLKVLGNAGLTKSFRIKADKFSYAAILLVVQKDGEIL